MIRYGDPLWTGQRFGSNICTCCTTGMLVVAHSKGDTSYGTGSLSRLSPTDGSTIWTVDFGTIDATYHWEAVAVDLDESGNAFVLMMPTKLSGGTYVRDDNASYKAGKVAKLDSTGNILATYTLPDRNAAFTLPTITPPEQRGSVVVDRYNTGRIYVGADYDTNGDWIHRFDSSLSLTWSSDPTYLDHLGATGHGIGRTTAMAVAPDGKIYAHNSRSSTSDICLMWRLNASDGSTDEYHVPSFPTPQLPQTYPIGSIAIDTNYTNGHARACGRGDAASSAGDRILVVGYDSSILDTSGSFDFTIESNDFTALATSQFGAGAWSSGHNPQAMSSFYDGTRHVVGSTSNWIWITGGVSKNVNPIAFDRNGAADWIHLIGFATCYGLAYDAEADAAFCCGATVTPSAGGYTAGRRVAKFDRTNGDKIWESELYTATGGLALFGWNLAARSYAAG